MFSPPDITDLLEILVSQDGNNYNNPAPTPLTQVFAGLVTSLGSYQLRFTGNMDDIYNKPAGYFSNDNIQYKYFDIMLQNKDSLEKAMLLFIKEALKLDGLNLYKLNEDGTSAKIELDSNTNQIIKKPC